MILSKVWIVLVLSWYAVLLILMLLMVWFYLFSRNVTWHKESRIWISYIKYKTCSTNWPPKCALHLALVSNVILFAVTEYNHPTCPTPRTFFSMADGRWESDFRLRSLWSYHPSCLVILLSLCGLNPLQSHAPTLHHNPEGINFLIIVIIIVTIMVNSHTMPMALCESRLRGVAFKTFGRD